MEGSIYHILNRGVEKRKIFLTEKDYLRFKDNVYDFNDKNLILHSYYNRKRLKNSVIASPNLKEKLVYILCWCLMPNHFHILVLEKISKGAGLFIKKNTNGYTRYFNEINKRSGVLFQGRSKIIPIENNSHFSWLPFYILANPLDLFQSDWREKGVKNPRDAFNFLLNYKWSSFYNFGDAITEQTERIDEKNKFLEIFNTTEEQFKKDFLEWLINYKEGCDFKSFRWCDHKTENKDTCKFLNKCYFENIFYCTLKI